MESLLVWLTDLGPHAPLIIFALLMITGFSLPVSEDLILLASGVLAATVLPDYTVQLFCAAFFGSFFSDCIAFGLGRLFGEKFYQVKGEGQIQRLKLFYEKYGVFALVVGRCIPFGIRNGIFMTAGAGKMPFNKFFICDCIACLGFSALLFILAYSCGKNYEALVTSVQQMSLWIGLVACAFIGASFIYFLTKRRKAKQAANLAPP